MTHLQRTLAIGGTVVLGLLTFTYDAAAQTPTTLYTFTGGGDGSGPTTGVTVGAGGVLYGTTGSAGTASYGTAFSLTPPATSGDPWTTSFYSFPGGRAAAPSNGPLAMDYGGSVLLGASPSSDTYGTVYMLNPPASAGGDWTQRVLLSFSDDAINGKFPNSVTVGGGGVLYGTTQYGGTGPYQAAHPGCGMVFSLTPPSTPGGSWTQGWLYSFAGPPNDGSYPTANVVVENGGVLYGTTSKGGANSNSGTVFSLTPPAAPGDPWTETVLYNFPATFYGCQPGQLIANENGALYGVAAMCGPGTNDGTVFALYPPASPGGEWGHATLHAFTGGATDGVGPNSLVWYGGALYGTTFSGGPGNLRSGGGNGTIFSLTPSEGGSWTETVLYFFTGGSDGANPVGIAVGNGGVLYGTTHSGGGSANAGTVFSFTP
ncbi:MAG: choice-of-anchor tandem repeat GloVer-containing protein [Bryobacteraceae bacterium]